MRVAPGGWKTFVVLVAALSGVLGFGARAAASDGARAFYEVPRECPGEAEWRRDVGARLPALLRTHPLLAALSVRIERLGDGAGGVYVGELVGAAGRELAEARRVRGSSCEEVLDALAFIGALGLERAASARAGSGGAAGSDETEAARRAGSEPLLAAGIQVASPAGVSGELQPVGADASGAPLVRAAARGMRLGAVVFGLVQGGLVPGQSVAVGAGVRAAWSAPGWEPLIAVGFYSSLPEERRIEGGGRVRYEHWSFHGVACPWRFPAEGIWGIRPCAEVDAGRSRGEASGVAAAEQHSAPWVSAGAQVRTELALWNRLELSVSLAAVAPLFRSHFFLYPGVERFDTPPLGLRAGSFAALLF